MSRPRLIALLLALITLAAYLPATRYEFTNYDDNDYVTNNPQVQAGLTAGGMKWAFTTGHAGNWHPLTWLSHMTDVTLFGMNPGAHHFVAALIHAANAALLFLLMLRLTRPGAGVPAGQPENLWPAALVAALFAWHPLRVESVAWVAERKDVLCAFFGLLALIFYTRYAQEKSRRSYALALLCFALGLMAKPMLVTLPCLLLLLDYWPLKRVAGCGLQVAGFENHNSPSIFNLRLLLEKIPFFAITAASCAITFLVQHSGHAVASLEQVPVHFRLANAPVAAVRYLLKLFWPTDLAIVYPLKRLPAAEIVFAIAALLLISALAWRWRTARPYFAVGWLWFLGTLVPVIGIVQVGSAAMADRYTYLPGIGILIAVVFGLAELVEKSPRTKKIAAGVAGVVLVASLGLTEKQLPHWRNSEALFRHAIAVTSDNDVAHVDLGAAFDVQGRTEEAFAEYRAAARINPDRPQIHFNLGLVLRKLGRHAEALAEFRETARLEPGNAAARSAAGGELAALGQLDAALKELAAASQINPRYGAAHLEIAKIYFMQGRDAEAVDELRAALRGEPDNFEILAAAAHYLAANATDSARDGRNALVLAIKANELSGRNQPGVFDILGMALAETGDFTNAVTCAQNALDLATAAKLKKLEPIEQRRELYKKNQPWRESFRGTNAP